MSQKEPIFGVLVIVPTLNEEKHIEKTVRALAQNAHPDFFTTIVVADGGSTDKTREIVTSLAGSYSNLHLIDNPRKFQSAGVNEAVDRYSEGHTYMVRCDAHSEYPHQFIERLVETCRKTDAESVVIPMDSEGSTCTQRAIAWVSDNPLGSGGSRHRGGNFSGWIEHGHHALFKIDTFIALNGYNTDLTHAEDVEYDSRLRASGGRIYMDANVRITYRPRSSFSKLARQYYKYGRGRSAAVLLNANALGLRQIAISLHFLLMLVSVLGGSVSSYLQLYFLAYLFLVAAISGWIAWKNKSTCGLLSGVAAVVMHVSWGFGFWTEVVAYLLRPREEEARR